MSLASLDLLDKVAGIARDAGAAILVHYAGPAEVRLKEDNSPVTIADEAAEAVILPALKALTPDVPIVSEEAASAGYVPDVAPAFWLVDPLDGTKEYLKRNGEFTVNIALIEAGKPVLGVVFAPALDRMFKGAAGIGAWSEDRIGVRPIACRHPPVDGIIVAASRSHGDNADLNNFLARFTVAARIDAGSSLKFCLIAAAEADLYPRFGPTMEWDTAAGHAVLAAAGGRVTDFDGTDLPYGKQGYRNGHFVAHGPSVM
ncbi:MAG TPA: 3'(2'),5'-bisphosphate nucleotidase CysQ [Stellaceae bacterium]|nr:3'(2'),5'-bisphosphate nucleotidase CysQ [Stellaceae bacterium]